MAASFEFLADDLADIRVNGSREIAEELYKRQSLSTPLKYCAIGHSCLVSLDSLQEPTSLDSDLDEKYASNPAWHCKAPHIYGFVSAIMRQVEILGGSKLILNL
jgi:hypothetical protein